MQTAKITSCSACDSLWKLKEELDKKIYIHIRNKRMNDVLGVEHPFSPAIYDQLLHYKRIVNKKILNTEYPSTSIDVQDIISRVKILLTQ